MVRYSMVRHVTWYGIVYYNIVCYNTTQSISIYYTIRIVKYSIVQYSIVWYSIQYIIQYSILQQNIVQYSMAQHSVVQYRIVQYSVAQCSNPPAPGSERPTLRQARGTLPTARPAKDKLDRAEYCTGGGGQTPLEPRRGSKGFVGRFRFSLLIQHLNYILISYIYSIIIYLNLPTDLRVRQQGAGGAGGQQPAQSRLQHSILCYSKVLYNMLQCTLVWIMVRYGIVYSIVCRGGPAPSRGGSPRAT